MSKSQKEMLQELEAEYKLEPNTGMVNEHEATLALFDNIKDDAINPSHYKHGVIETIDYMKAISSIHEYNGHLRLTAIKYLSRLGKKDKASQEVGKAIWYLEKLKESLIEEEEAFRDDN